MRSGVRARSALRLLKSCACQDGCFSIGVCYLPKAEAISSQTLNLYHKRPNAMHSTSTQVSVLPASECSCSDAPWPDCLMPATRYRAITESGSCQFQFLYLICACFKVRVRVSLPWTSTSAMRFQGIRSVTSHPKRSKSIFNGWCPLTFHVSSLNNCVSGCAAQAGSNAVNSLLHVYTLSLLLKALAQGKC
jgi:hypothetical protein